MVEELGDYVKVTIGESFLEGVNTGDTELEDAQHVACVMRPRAFS